MKFKRTKSDSGQNLIQSALADARGDQLSSIRKYAVAVIRKSQCHRAIASNFGIDIGPSEYEKKTPPSVESAVFLPWRCKDAPIKGF